MIAPQSRVSRLVGAGRIRVSFEFFPPKTEEMEKSLWESVGRLAPLSPLLGIGVRRMSRSARPFFVAHDRSSSPARERARRPSSCALPRSLTWSRSRARAR